MITPEMNDARAYSAATAQQLGWERVNKRGYEILEQPYGLHSQKRIVVVGAGATGICMAKFVESIPNLDIQIYEKNDDLAGTWWENRYPGCACDIPAHIYQFMWALNPNWSSYYVPADEILRYMHKVIEEHDLRKYVKVQHKVISARWDSATSKWNLVLELPNGTTVDDECDFLLNAAGLLNNWKWPDIKGLQSFEGNLTHSAAYDTSIDLTNKRVAVFGSGSSGVQIVAKSQPIVEHLYTWIRSPIWLSGGFASSFAGPDGANFQYSDEVKKRFAEDPEFHLRYVKMLEAELGVRFNYNLTGTEEAKTAVKYAKEQMERKLESLPGLAEKIIPTTYGIGCRRPTPGNGYLEALASSNVTTYTNEVREISPKGFIDHEGNEHEVDVIICATGFDTSYVPRFPVYANGKDLRDVFQKDPVSYFSVMMSEFPNYFMSLGPYSAANGSLMYPIEHGCKYILEIVKKCQVERIAAIVPKMEAMQDFREHADLLLKRTVFTQPCRSWYKGGSATGLPRMYPGSRAHFVQNMKPRYEDFEIKYESMNRYYFMGNGFSLKEFDGSDTTWYFGLLDGVDEEPDYSKDEAEIKQLSGL